MVKNYQRKSSRGAYGEQALKDALEALSKGMPFKELRLRYGISRSVLMRHRAGKVSNPGCIKLGRYGRVNGKKIENLKIVNDPGIIKEEVDSLHDYQVSANESLSEIESYSGHATATGLDLLQLQQCRDCLNFDECESIRLKCSLQSQVDALSAVNTLRHFFYSHDAPRELNKSLDLMQLYISSLTSSLNPCSSQSLKSKLPGHVTVFREIDDPTVKLQEARIELDRIDLLKTVAKNKVKKNPKK